MDDITTARTARIELLAPNDREKSDQSLARRPLKPKPALHKVTEPLLDAELEKEEQHKLDELA